MAVVPMAALILSAIFAAVARGEPRRDNLVASMLPFATRWIVAVALVGALHVLDHLHAHHDEPRRHPGGPDAPGVVIAILGSQLNKVRSNVVMGIRTPWTLDDDQVWQRTHQIGRWPLALSGVVIFVASLVAPSPAQLLTLTLSLMLALAAVLTLLSYLLWRAAHRVRE
jgi:uncharacterized membrane protein